MLTKQAVNQWKSQGYTFVKGLIEKELLQICRNHIQQLYDTKQLLIKDFGSQGKLQFPSLSVIDRLTLHPKIIQSVQTLLNDEQILLAQSDAWGKIGKQDYSESSNNNQRMHMDYGNNSFLHPSDWNNPQTVAMIVYLSDIKQTGGGTSVVPRKNSQDQAYSFPYIKMPGQNGLPFINDCNSAEKYFKQHHPHIYNFRQELYQRQIISQPSFGQILFYRYDIWHRGTPVKPGKLRFVLNLLWKKKNCTWINVWNPGWTKKMYYGNLQKLITQINPLQRSVLGIPKIEDPYWTQETIELFAKRYPGINIQPYKTNLLLQ